VARTGRRGTTTEDTAHNGRGSLARFYARAPATVERERVAEIQRARMLAAMVDLTRELGAERVTVAHVVARAGVSRRTFYEIFSDREACLLAALDEAIEQIAEAVLEAYESERTWQGRMRASLTAMLAHFDEQPGPAALCVVDALGAGPAALGRRDRAVDAMVEAVDSGRREAKGVRGLNSVTAEGMVGAVLAILHARLRVADPKPLLPLRGQLMSMIVLPYFGPEAAETELTLRAPRQRRSRPPEDPLKDLDIRLTYRTMRVLTAVAERPGLNNRRVARESGVVDQGQISKLLSRLEGIGLLVNVGESGHGEANAWRLTERGHELEQAIRSRVDH
jgi:AcrR family transcriptional regulator